MGACTCISRCKQAQFGCPHLCSMSLVAQNDVDARRPSEAKPQAQRAGATCRCLATFFHMRLDISWRPAFLRVAADDVPTRHARWPTLRRRPTSDHTTVDASRPDVQLSAESPPSAFLRGRYSLVISTSLSVELVLLTQRATFQLCASSPCRDHGDRIPRPGLTG